MHKVKYTKNAKLNLDNILSKIFQDKPKSAIAYARKIKEFISHLDTNPEMGKECKYLGIDRKCRVLIYENYIIEYKIFKNHISIASIKNTKQKRK